MGNDLVSIIMPAYNCSKFIGEAINSVIEQSYTNWELIIVDDCSSDNTAEIIMQYVLKDDKICYLKNEKNSGTAISRNKAIEKSKGRFIAFLDSDDMWKSNKLEKQIKFMKENNYLFTCTAYEKIDENSFFLNHIVEADEKSNYHRLLKKCPGNSTIVYDCFALGKHYIPYIKKRNDYVMWLQIIKKAKNIYGMKEVLASHRICKDSLSSNKKSLLKYHWYVYRKVEKLSLVYSTYLMIYWVLKSILRLKR